MISRYFCILALFFSVFISVFSFLNSRSWSYPKHGELVDSKVQVSSYPEQGIKYNRLVVESEHIESKILVYKSIFPEVEYLDVLDLTCKLHKPENFSEFDYREYLQEQDIGYICYYPQWEVIDNYQDKNLITQVRYFTWKSREAIQTKLEQNLLEPDNSIIQAFLLSNKSLLSDRIIQKFRRAGISHVLVVSGLHISLLIYFLFFILKKFPHRIRNVSIIGFLFFYLMLLDFPASATRASLMGCIYLLTKDRVVYNIFYSLIYTTLILLLIKPDWLIHDISFQLSVLAVSAIGLALPVLRKIPNKNIVYNYIVNTLILSGFINVFLGPIILYQFGEFSMVGIFSNLVIILILPPVFITVLSGLILPIGSDFCFFYSHLGVEYILEVVAYFSQFPVIKEDITLMETLGVYVLLLSVYLFFYKKNRL